MQVQFKRYKLTKQTVRLVSATCVAIAMYGCSSTEINIDNEQVMTPEQQQLFILEKVESWSAAEPNIERVLALEADMQLIINQLANMAELDSDPLNNDKVSSDNSINTGKSNIQTSSNTVEDSQKTNVINSPQTIYSSSNTNNNVKPLSKANNNVKSSSRSLSHYFPKVGLHIGMFKDVNRVQLGWLYLQSKLPDELVNGKPLLAKVNYKGNEYYSLRIGPFKSANSAKKACLNLQKQEHYCSVVEYKGTSVNFSAL